MQSMKMTGQNNLISVSKRRPADRAGLLKKLNLNPSGNARYTLYQAVQSEKYSV